MARPPRSSYAGAGGDWRARHEQADRSILAQAGKDHCCVACVCTILRSRNLLATQSAIANQIGTPSSPKVVAAYLSKKDSLYKWELDYFETHDLPFLNRKLPWIALLKDFGNPHYHAVLIDGFDEQNRLIVRDPWPPGTRYLMTMEDLAHSQHGWTGLAIYAEQKKPKRR